MVGTQSRVTIAGPRSLDETTIVSRSPELLSGSLEHKIGQWYFERTKFGYGATQHVIVVQFDHTIGDQVGWIQSPVSTLVVV